MKNQFQIQLKSNSPGFLFLDNIWSYSTKIFVNVFYSIPNMNLQFNLLKEMRVGILVYIFLAQQCNITNDKK